MSLPHRNGKQKTIALVQSSAGNLKSLTHEGLTYIAIESLTSYFGSIMRNTLTPPKTKIELARVIGILNKVKENAEKPPEPDVPKIVLP